MIRVEAQPEPSSFDIKVRKKGLKYIETNHIDLGAPLPRGQKLNPFWRDCLDDLYNSYNGTCAYLAVFFERCMGGGTVDHFVAKSKRVDKAYEWNNYRLACSIMNSRKRDFDDVIDPFEMVNGWFYLELVSGRIYPNPDCRDAEKVKKTIDRLGLDDSMNREMRARHYQGYRERLYTADYLKKFSPFVYQEAERQKLL